MPIMKPKLFHIISLFFIVLYLPSKSQPTFTPQNILDLKCWYNADSISSSSNFINTIFDKSGNNNHLLQSTQSNQPTLISNYPTLNNHPIFDFSLNNYMSTQVFPEILQPFTLFIVYKQNDNSNRVVVSSANSPNQVFIFSGNGSGNAGATLGANFNITDWGIYSYTFNNTTSSFTNGTDTFVGNPGNNSLDRLALGGWTSPTSFPFDGEIAEVIVYSRDLSNNEIDSLYQYAYNKFSPPINLGPAIQSVCDTSITLTLPDYFSQILWSTGETTQSITINQSDTINVQATDIFGFQSSDTVILENFQNKYYVNSLSDTTSCGLSVNWDTELDSVNYSFLWNNGDTTKTLNITTSNLFYVTVTDSAGCVSNSDTVSVIIDSLSIQTSLGPDKTVCKGSNIGLVSGQSTGLSYLWNTGDTTSQIVVNIADTFFIEVTNDNNCIGRDTIIIDTNGIAPTVNFTAQNFCSNSPTSFINTSITSDGSNIISEKWFFGDGDSTSIQNPSHQYLTSTTYNLSIVITTDSGCVNTLDSIIEIHKPPTTGFFVSTNPICSGDLTNFTDNSFSTDGTVNTWLWNFGDTGTVDTSSLQHPSYEFPITNIYNVQLITTTQHGCSDTATNSITVKQSPINSFTTSNLCIGSNTQFTNTSQGNIFALNWDFGDFNTSTLNDPSHSFSTPGAHLVSLATTEVNGCSDTTETLITIFENPIANFDVIDFCAESSTQLFDSSSTNSGIITNWNWNIVNHSNNSIDQHPTFSFTTIDTGYYYLDLIVTTDFGCTDSIRDSINILPLPVPDFNFDPTTGAPPLTVNFTNITNGNNQYLWSFGDDSSSILHSPSHIYQDSSNYNIKLIATSSYGCIDSTNKSIYIIDPITDIAVNNINYNFSSNSDFLSLTAELYNLGTFPITNIDLEIEISGKGTVSEKWVGSIGTGSNLNYQISSSFETGGEIPDAICIRALNPNNETDINSVNNEFCITINKFQLLSISPNPTASKVNLDYIIPNDGEVSIDLYDVSGKKVAQLFSGNLQKGLIRQSFNLVIYGNGIHIIAINYQGNIIKEKVLIK
jgi:PKD repeat protein